MSKQGVRFQHPWESHISGGVWFIDGSINIWAREGEYFDDEADVIIPISTEQLEELQGIITQEIDRRKRIEQSA